MSALCCALISCGSFGRQDGPPSGHVDVSQIQDAVPKYEPLSQYGNPPSYVALGKRYVVLDSADGYDEKGYASWYGTKFHGALTSTRERYNMLAMSAAHKTLPIPCYAKVTNLDNGRSIIVRVNDRGPFHQGRIIDLSYAAAKKLAITQYGTAKVRVQGIDPRANKHQPHWWSHPTRSASSTALYLQVGAYGQLKNARKQADRLHQSTGLQGLVKRAYGRHQTLYHVYLGPLSSESSLRSLQHRLKREGIASDARHLDDTEIQRPLSG